MGSSAAVPRALFRPLVTAAAANDIVVPWATFQLDLYSPCSGAGHVVSEKSLIRPCWSCLLHRLVAIIQLSKVPQRPNYQNTAASWCNSGSGIGRLMSIMCAVLVISLSEGGRLHDVSP